MFQRGLIFLMLLGLVCTPALAQNDFSSLLPFVPKHANAVMAIDVEAVLNSPIAVSENWKSQQEATYVKRPTILPPEADKMIVASKMRFEDGLQQDWELAVMRLTEPFSMRAVARAEGGYVDTINGSSAAWTPSNAYFVNLKPDVMGVMSPANRQEVARWTRWGQARNTVVISEYLTAIPRQIDQTSAIVLAMDLADLILPHKLHEFLQDWEDTRDNPASQTAWQDVLMSLQGIRVEVQFSADITGKLSVDFEKSPAIFGKSAHSLVLGALDEAGVAIDDLEEWKTEIEGQSIQLSGEISRGGLRRILSLLELPSAKFSTLKDDDPNDKDPETIAKASKRYYQSVETLLDDLRKDFETNRDARRTMAPVYLERYGRKIDRLPILHVDPELLDFGAAVSATLREISTVQKTGAVKSGVRKSQTYGAYSYNYDSAGYRNFRSTSSVRSQISREEEGKTRAVRFSSWKQIEDSLSEIRIAMTKKYRVEF